MADVINLPTGALDGSRFKTELRQGGVAGFSVIYGPLNDNDWNADPSLPTWAVAIRTRGADDNIIMHGTFDPSKGPWPQFEQSMCDHAAIILQALMHATLNPGAFDDFRNGAA